MRSISLAIILMLLIVACNGNDDGIEDDVITDDPTPTIAVEEETPAAVEPSPTPVEEATPVEDATPVEEATPVNDEADDFAQIVDQIAENTIELRGLELLEEPDVQVISRDELREMFDEEVVVEQADLDLYWMLRLVDDRDIDLQSIIMDLQVEAVGGLYDAETGEIYVIGDDPELSPLGELILAHEIVHALQDQHFGLDRIEDFVPDYDRVMTFSALVEGDATLFETLYIMEYFDAADLMEIQGEVMGQQQQLEAILDEVPRYIFESFIFPYTAGAVFAETLYQQDGFDALNAALEDPPDSTEQILNPDKYLTEPRDVPLEVEMPDLSDVLGEGWEQEYEGTLGQFDLAILLEEAGLEPENDVDVGDVVEPAGTAAEGWGGTEFLMYGTGDDLLTLLATRWDTEEDAAEFEEALRQTMAGYDQENGDIWFDGERYHAITSDGDRVDLVTATDQDSLQSVLDAL